MLSKLALQQGVFSSFLRNDASSRLFLANIRLFSDHPVRAAPPPKAEVEVNPEEEMKKTVANWDYANQLFYGPKRDHEKFPIIRQPVHSPPTRLGFVPETWFQALYSRTGVTGPYAFGFGLITFLLSKEIVIVEHQFAHFLSFWITFYVLHKKFGDKIAQALDKKADSINNTLYIEPMKKAADSVMENTQELEKAIWREEGQKSLFEVKKENIDLQLESVYRQRLAEIHQSVKKRLDYHVEVENLQKRVEQQNMVDWIVRSVVKGITPQQEKDSITKCIADLKSLASKQPVAA